MKYTFLGLLIFLSCQKQPPQCPDCILVIGNGTTDLFKVEITGKTISKKFDVPFAGIKQVVIPSGEDVRVFGRPITDKAHSNFNQVYRCDDFCGAISVILDY